MRETSGPRSVAHGYGTESRRGPVSESAKLGKLQFAPTRVWADRVRRGSSSEESTDELPSWIPFGRRRSAFRIPTRGRADASLCGLCRLSSFEDPSSHGPRRAPKRKRPTKAGLFSPGRGRDFTSRFVPQTNHSLSKEVSGEPRRAEPDLSEILQSLARGPIRSSGGRFF